MCTYQSHPLTSAVEPSRGATTTQEHYGERRWQVDSQSCVLAVELIQTSEITAETGRLCAATATFDATGWPGSAPRAGGAARQAGARAAAHTVRRPVGRADRAAHRPRSPRPRFAVALWTREIVRQLIAARIGVTPTV